MRKTRPVADSEREFPNQTRSELWPLTGQNSLTLCLLMPPCCTAGSGLASATDGNRYRSAGNSRPAGQRRESNS